MASAKKTATAKKTGTKKAKPSASAAKNGSTKAANTKAASTKVVGTKDLAAVLGVALTKRMDTAAVRKLRKPLPGYVNLLDDVATLLEGDAELLNLRDVTPDQLRTLQDRQKYLSAREGVAEAVYRSIYEQRLQVDDEAMGKLLKIARRIDVASEDDPDVLVRWKSLLDFLAKFRRTAGSSAEPEPEAAKDG